jgi:hypothetical protein
MVVFRGRVAPAVDCAVRMRRNVEALDPGDPALLRVGISAGEVADEGTERSGRRWCRRRHFARQPAPQHTLATEVVANLVGSRGGREVRPVGLLPMKGLPRPRWCPWHSRTRPATQRWRP